MWRLARAVHRSPAVCLRSASNGARIETDDQFAALFEYDNGALGVIEASRVAGGHLVTSRKISGGSRSPDGTATKVALATLFGTWHAQGVNPFLACRQLLSPQV